MRANPLNSNNDQASIYVLVNFRRRESFWEERHAVAPVERVRKAHKKWQCLACGKCGFVEMSYGEERLKVIHRIGHGCKPENIAFYYPGTHRPLTD